MDINVHNNISSNSQKVKTKMSFNWWMDKQIQYRYMEYYTAIKKEWNLTHATTWMNLEKIMLSEKGKTEKVMYHMI